MKRIDMKPNDITAEEWREYTWDCPVTGQLKTYRISHPVTLWIGNTTHRVLDSAGIVHCVPNVGQLGCVVRWKPKDTANPVQF